MGRLVERRARVPETAFRPRMVLDGPVWRACCIACSAWWLLLDARCNADCMGGEVLPVRQTLEFFLQFAGFMLKLPLLGLLLGGLRVGIAAQGLQATIDVLLPLLQLPRLLQWIGRAPPQGVPTGEAPVPPAPLRGELSQLFGGLLSRLLSLRQSAGVHLSAPLAARTAGPVRLAAKPLLSHLAPDRRCEPDPQPVGPRPPAREPASRRGSPLRQAARSGPSSSRVATHRATRAAGAPDCARRSP